MASCGTTFSLSTDNAGLSIGSLLSVSGSARPGHKLSTSQWASLSLCSSSHACRKHGVLKLSSGDVCRNKLGRRQLRQPYATIVKGMADGTGSTVFDIHDHPNHGDMPDDTSSSSSSSSFSESACLSRWSRVKLAVPAKLLGKILLLSLLAAPCINFALPNVANAAAKSIAQSSLGQRIAATLRASDWPDAAIIFLISMLPVLELRGAVPVGHWMGLEPFWILVVSVLGNMVPVPFILLYLGKLSTYLTERSDVAKRFFTFLFDHTRAKAGPIEEFKWLGLMLFVAVPLPGTGAWSGAIAAHILDMPFWDAMLANFYGVVIAGLIMNMFCTVGLKSACIAGAVLFVLSSCIWSVFRLAKEKLGWDKEGSERSTL